ncbi:MAG TPA: hypothetical protein DEP53_01670, partial [Bacteroidetes bacterium]|nr:hypothetical protein [Bacteroidota bacterium]
YFLPKAGAVRISVFNSIGQDVATIVEGWQTEGQHVASFDASRLASGVYMYRLTFEGAARSRSMCLVK